MLSPLGAPRWASFWAGILSRPATGWRAGCWLIFGKIRPQEKSVIFRSPELRSQGHAGPTLGFRMSAKAPVVWCFAAQSDRPLSMRPVHTCTNQTSLQSLHPGLHPAHPARAHRTRSYTGSHATPWPVSVASEQRNTCKGWQGLVTGEPGADHAFSVHVPEVRLRWQPVRVHTTAVLAS
eukprot:COSAG01_NODE_6353_length_3718_cov_11.827853_1_plen_179_part_00